MISATNSNLEQQIKEGRFRRDLYYRVKVVELGIPSLRERGPGDICRLAEHFFDVYVRRHRRQVKAISEDAMTRLQAYDWPGNVRELEHCVESAVVLATGDIVGAEHLSLPQSTTPVPEASGYPSGTPLAEVELDHIRRTLEACEGNRTEAARLLGIGRNTLARKLKDRGV